MAFLEDPRLRQRWNEISHNAEAVTENAAASIWTFQHTYITPCLDSVTKSLDSCTTVCLGDREERARRARERERGARGSRAELSFDFYDDWDDDDEAMAGFSGASSGGLLGNWAGTRGEDWDRLIGGSGSARNRQDGARIGGARDIVDQPRRKRGMSYGTRGGRRKTAEEEPTIIPSTAPLGFLGRLPWKIGGTLRYKPSAANLRDHPGPLIHMVDENAPLLGGSDEEDVYPERSPQQVRKRSGTTGSGDTSDSYRSRGDLFPSDGEGDEDAVPLDDEFTVALARVDDRSSSKTKSSKGKRPAGDKSMARSLSRTTVSSTQSRRPSLHARNSSNSLPTAADQRKPRIPSLEDLQMEEERVEQEEIAEIERKRAKAVELAAERGLSRDDELVAHDVAELKHEMIEVDEIPEPSQAEHPPGVQQPQDGFTAPNGTAEAGPKDDHHQQSSPPTPSRDEGETPQFVPARLPAFR